MIVQANPEGVHFGPIPTCQAERTSTPRIARVQADELIFAFDRPSRVEFIFNTRAKNVTCLGLRDSRVFDFTVSKTTRRVNQRRAERITNPAAHGAEPIQARLREEDTVLYARALKVCLKAE